MSDSNGVFVKIFRDKEAWDKQANTLEIAKGKFESEEDYRKKLAVEAGLTEEQAKLKFNSHIDPKLFYPELDCNSPEYIAWRFGLKEENCRDSTKEEIERYDRDCGWPTELLEEMGLFRKYQIFESYNYLNFTGGSVTCHFRVLCGKCGQRRYLVAWWGEKEYYDKIQEKLSELREPKQQELPSQSNDNSLGVFKGLAYASFIGVIMIMVAAGIITYLLSQRSDYKSQAPETVAAQTTSFGCIDCDCKFDRKPCNSVCDLPVGKVLKKHVDHCTKGKEHYYLLYFEDGHTQSYWLVTKDVFDKVNLGDEIPFQRPEY